MCTSIKSISVTYDAINENNTFSSGDYISGHVTLEVAKETKIKSFLVKAKGKVSVLWTERHGSVTMVYYNKETCFKLEHFFIRDEQESNEKDGALEKSEAIYSDVILPGRHVYPFTFQIPQHDMPSTFNGEAGKVVYFIEAKLNRSMRLSSKDKTEFTFLSKTDVHDPDMKEAQFGTAEKNLRFFNTGSLSVQASIERVKYYSGDKVKISAEIQNDSSRAITPKYCLYQKQTFVALNKSRVWHKDVLKEQGEPINPSASQNVSFLMSIPSDIVPSILCCDILKLEYRLKVYLDIKYSRDPKVKFPLVICAAPQITDGAGAGAGEAAAAAGAEPVEPPPSYQDLYPPPYNPSVK